MEAALEEVLEAQGSGLMAATVFWFVGWLLVRRERTQAVWLGLGWGPESKCFWPESGLPASCAVSSLLLREAEESHVPSLNLRTLLNKMRKLMFS